MEAGASVSDDCSPFSHPDFNISCQEISLIVVKWKCRPAVLNVLPTWWDMNRIHKDHK